MTGKTANIPLIKTKLQKPPIVGAHIHRSKLVEKLDQRRKRPLSLITAPAGYGKSTLASCWLDNCDVAVSWLSLDEADNDLQLFLLYMAAAIQSAYPGTLKDFQSILNTSQLPPFPILVNTLINDLDQIKKDMIFAIDDYHVIQNQDIHSLFIELLKHPIPGMHLVLLSRIDPPLPLMTLRAKGKMNEIRIQDLRFSIEETAECLRDMLDQTIDDDSITMLWEKTEGWVTGVRMAALSLRHYPDMERVLSELPSDNRYVIDYLVAEVLAQQTPAMKRYLTRSAVLDRFCAPVLHSVCSDLESTYEKQFSGQQFLDQLIKDNLFLIPLDNEHRWYRYHHMFQELLKRNLTEQASHDEVNTIHRRAGEWFGQNGLIEEALKHYSVCSETLAMVRLIAKHRYNLMNQEQWQRLERWLNLLPPDSVAHHPELILTKAWLCEIGLRLSEMDELLATFETFFDDPTQKTIQDRNALLGEYHALSAINLYMQGQGDAVIESAEKALDTIDSQAFYIQGFAKIMRAGGFQMTGQLKKAYSALHTDLTSESREYVSHHSLLLFAHCIVNWIAADLVGMSQVAQQLLKLGQRFRLVHSVSYSYYFLGIGHYMQGELSEAETQLRLAVQDIYKVNTPNYGHSMCGLALCLQAQSRSEEAMQIVENLIGDALEIQNAELLALGQAVQAELAYRQGNMAKADQWVQNYDPHPFNPGYRFFLPQLTMVKTLIGLNTEESIAKATELLFQLDDYFTSINNKRFLIDVRMLQALLHFIRGDQEPALASITWAALNAEPGSMVRPFVDAGTQMAHLLSLLVMQNSEVGIAGRVLAAFRIERSAELDHQTPTSLGANPILEVNGDVIDELSKREREVLKLIAQRLSNKEIAEKLFVSPGTVKQHLHRIFQKLHVSDRREAAATASALGLI